MLISKLKTIKRLTKYNKPCQQKVSIKKNFFFKLFDKGIKNIDKFLNKKSVAYKLVLKVLILKSHRYDVVLLSQDRIATEAGVSKRTVNTTLQELIKDGLLAMSYRHRKVCSYMLSNIFKVEAVKRRLRYFFKAIIFLPVLLLFSINLKEALSEYCIPMKEEKEYILRNNNILFQERSGVVQKKSNFRSLGESMKMKDDILGEIAKIERVKLTKRGIIELLKYPPEAITYLNQQLTFASSNIRNLTGWIFSILNGYVKDNDLKLNMDMSRRMLQLSNFKGDETMLESNKLVRDASLKGRATGHNGMYTPYIHEERKENPIEDEVRKWEEFANSPAAETAKALGIFQEPPRIKEYRRLQSAVIVE